ncbi:hypothetical protein [Amycolatopsis anabasis]|uniref:hypothetical protein n=1 Tax=Amycolatopsis anabasis TaxID=1840409 RepID=UPI00131BA348|nr:hypothetical protein [Amycolatopsis anabasis]
MRLWRTLVVAADSPLGRVAPMLDELTAHLPPPNQPWACSLCSTESWPCSRFDQAAHHLRRAGLRLSDLIPLDLHPRLWPPPGPRPPQQPAPPPARPDLDEERPPDG